MPIIYHDHFGLNDSPFTIAPDPRFLYMSARHREALAHLLFGIDHEGGFVLLTGEVGTGKTTVCRCLLEQLPEQTQVACILNPRLSVVELLAALCDELRIPYPEGNTSIKVFIDRLNAFLLESHARGRNTVLIIDEAQNLSIDVLEQIRLLTNLETSRRKLLQIVLLGQPELREKLARPELRQLRQRITACYHLQPLSRRETADYVVHRLAVAGLSRPVFTPRAVARIYCLSGGIPRQINLICDRALLGAYARGIGVVDLKMVGRAAAELEIRGGTRNSLRSVAAAAVVGVLLSLAAFALAFSFWSIEEETIAVAPISSPVEEAVGSPELTPTPTISLDAAVEPPFAWPADLSGARSGDRAYQTLLAAWGVAYDPGRHGNACDFAGQQGLACLFRRGSLGSLRLLDRPAVLTLRDVDGQAFLATLTALPESGEEAAVLVVDGIETTVPLRELDRRWLGEYVLLWRKPPFEKMLRPGDRGPEIDWLARRLAQVSGAPLPARRGSRLEGDLLARLKAFQQSRGLKTDGLVGPTTLIHLDSALGGGSPRLVETPGES